MFPKNLPSFPSKPKKNKKQNGGERKKREMDISLSKTRTAQGVWSSVRQPIPSNTPSSVTVSFALEVVRLQSRPLELTWPCVRSKQLGQSLAPASGAHDVEAPLVFTPRQLPDVTSTLASRWPGNRLTAAA